MRPVDGASSTTGLIQHTLSTCPPNVISLLYKGLVHPKLEFGMSQYFKKIKYFKKYFFFKKNLSIFKKKDIKVVENV